MSFIEFPSFRWVLSLFLEFSPILFALTPPPPPSNLLTPIIHHSHQLHSRKPITHI